MTKPKPIPKQPERIVEPNQPPSDVLKVSCRESDGEIKIHRRCPVCWERCKGVGVSYSTQGRTRYYKCKRTLTDLPPCGHTWSATVQLHVMKVEHRTIELDGER